VTAAPSAETFAERFAKRRAEFGPLCLGLDPSDDVLGAWGVDLDGFVDIALDAAAGSVAVVKPQSAFYERHGWQGVRSLSRLVSGCREGGVLVLLDAKRGDVGSTNEAYAAAYLGDGAPIHADAMTVTPYLGLAAMGAYIERGPVFVVTRSSNPEGRAVQAARGPDGLTVEQRMVLDIGALNARLAPGAVGPVGGVFGPTHAPPDDMDLAAMNGLFLAPGLGTQGATPADVAACFAACPDRVLPSASRSLLAAGPTVAGLRAAVRALSDELSSLLG
jgi:orotidine-5'-phosphate decarboxylase